MNIKITIIALSVIAVASGIGLFFSLTPTNYPGESIVLPINKDTVSDNGTGYTFPDTDGDGIPDSSDSCPTQAETFNRVDDKDGCPDIFSDESKSYANFEECANAGGQVMESYPRQCRTQEGKIFTEFIK